MASTILVTGVAGFIGSHLAEALLTAGHHVIGLDCFTDYYARQLKHDNLAPLFSDPSFRFVEADLAVDEIRPTLSGVDGIAHLAGQPGVRGSWGEAFDLYVRNNVLATQRLLDAAVTAGGVPVVYASSSSVYGNLPTMPLAEDMPPAPVSPYGVTKLAAEHLCRLYTECYAIPTASLRLFTVYGPRQRPDMAFQRFFEGMLENRTLSIYGDGSQMRDFTYVTDVVTAFVLALDLMRSKRAAPDGRGWLFNIAGGSHATVREVLSLLAKVSGREPTVLTLPAQAGDVRQTWADTTRAREVLGYTPVTDLRSGLAHQWLAVSAARTISRSMGAPSHGPSSK